MWCDMLAGMSCTWSLCPVGRGWEYADCLFRRGVEPPQRDPAGLAPSWCLGLWRSFNFVQLLFFVVWFWFVLFCFVNWSRGQLERGFGYLGMLSSDHFATWYSVYPSTDKIMIFCHCVYAVMSKICLHLWSWYVSDSMLTRVNVRREESEFVEQIYSEYIFWMASCRKNSVTMKQ